MKSAQPAENFIIAKHDKKKKKKNKYNTCNMVIVVISCSQ